ncbi:MAG: sulfite exporter TauE/SafE family protein [Gammaproteobacteria bacterium]|nr:sulfite exporter TauE/SafE family protein [Gammaproteobacteria bacterium]
METIIQTALLENQPSFYIALVIFATGLLTSITPCIYPMLPITSAVIANQAKNNKQSVYLSLSYVFGLALVYAMLGLMAASTGQLFGSIASSPLALIFVAIICLLMAAWILGYLKMPQQTINLTIKTSSSTFNVFVAGAISGLVMAPCTSPVLGMLLMYVAGQGNPYWAGLLMFIFAFGMSALLILAGSVSGFVSLLPRSGQWLNASKWLFAAMMTGSSIYFFNQALT